MDLNLFFHKLGFLKGRMSINNKYFWLDLAYWFIFSSTPFSVSLAIGSPAVQPLALFVLIWSWGCFKMTPVTSFVLFCFVYYII